MGVVPVSGWGARRSEGVDNPSTALSLREMELSVGRLHYCRDRRAETPDLSPKEMEPLRGRAPADKSVRGGVYGAVMAAKLDLSPTCSEEP